MATMRISPLMAQLGQLVGGGVSRIGIRTIKTAPPANKKPHGPPPVLPPGHGERLFVFHHIWQGMTVLSTSPVMKPRSLRQIPFRGKKLQPAKIRKDQWKPLAMIQFPEGQGEVGRSVYERMMECRKLHDYAWDDEMLYDERGKILSKRERGRAMNQKQKAFTVADMAAVLGGLGKGNKVVVAPDTEAAGEGETEGTPATAVENSEAFFKTDDGTTLVRATVWWDNPQDKNYAKTWPKNVRHELFENAVLVKAGAEAAAAPEAELGDQAQAATATA
ncbi:hypothetical protein F5Y17DRAFT_44059 [Xylariaceae sp. FL0594]|nr:hypothetical protein F5Y17DRAFT_44059 [Xylariaceae sp. FL0594]